MPRQLERFAHLKMRWTDLTPGSVSAVYSFPVDFLYQSRICTQHSWNLKEGELTRPTKGEMRVTPASAQATAWPKPKRRVRLQWMPSLSSCLAAWIPS